MKHAEIYATCDLLIDALRLPRGTEIIGLSLDAVGLVHIIVTHNALPDTDGPPPLAKVVFERIAAHYE